LVLRTYIAADIGIRDTVLKHIILMLAAEH